MVSIIIIEYIIYITIHTIYYCINIKFNLICIMYNLMVNGYWLPTIRRDYNRVGSAVWL